MRRSFAIWTLLAVSLVFLVSCSSKAATSLQSDLEAELKPGMSVEDIHRVLDRHDIEYDLKLRKASEYSDLDDQLPPDTLVIGAGKHFDNGDFLDVIIVLDDDLRFTRLISKISKPVL